MLWYRAWLETRLRFLISLTLLSLFVIPLRAIAVGQANGVLNACISAAYIIGWVSLLFAGDGMTTQAFRRSAQPALFTLALPVSRLRLLGSGPRSDGWS